MCSHDELNPRECPKQTWHKLALKTRVQVIFWFIDHYRKSFFCPGSKEYLPCNLHYGRYSSRCVVHYEVACACLDDHVRHPYSNTSKPNCDGHNFSENI